MQSRWGRDLEYQCCSYDTWRRMEQIRRAKAHVTRAGYKQKLERICNASAEKIEAAMACVGEKAAVRDVLRSAECDADLKEALAELQIFTTDVVGSDGARARLRHEQNGFCLVFGQAGGFLTPNMSDVRSPLVVQLHNGGVAENHLVNLLDECPDMPSLWVNADTKGVVERTLDSFRVSDEKAHVRSELIESGSFMDWFEFQAVVFIGIMRVLVLVCVF